MSKSIKPRIGHVVHFVSEQRGEPCRAGIITGTIRPIEGHPDLETVVLNTFTSEDVDMYSWTADHSEDAPFTGTWHSIEGCPLEKDGA